MFLYLGHLVGFASHLVGVAPYSLVFLRDTGISKNCKKLFPELDVVFMRQRFPLQLGVVFVLYISYPLQ